MDEIKSDAQRVIEKLDLVQNVNDGGILKVSGFPVNFAMPEDEFSRFLISEIKNLYLCTKKASNLSGLSLEEIQAISSDIKTYVEYLEGVCTAYLRESKCKSLLEK